MQTFKQIKTLVDLGMPVFWQNESCPVIRDSTGQYLINHKDSCVGLHETSYKPGDFITLSSVIHESAFYSICYISKGFLTIQSKKSRKGIALHGDESLCWLVAFKTAMDDKEADFIARAILEGAK